MEGEDVRPISNVSLFFSIVYPVAYTSLCVVAYADAYAVAYSVAYVVTYAVAYAKSILSLGGIC